MEIRYPAMVVPTDTPVEFEDRIANLLCPWLTAHDVLFDLQSFSSHGRPFVMRGPADNAGPLEPFAHAAAEGRFAVHLDPTRIVEGWMAAYAQGAAQRRTRGLVEDDAPSYGGGTAEYMRSQGGYGVTLECGQHAGEPVGKRHGSTPVIANADAHIVFPDASALPGHEWFYFAQASQRRLL